jgi:hypothetical protein
VRAPQPAVEVVLRIVALVAVEHAIRGLLVLIPDLFRGAVDRERGGPTLRVGGAVDAVCTIEKRDASGAEVESRRQRRIGNVRTPLRLEHIESREAGTPHVVVTHSLRSWDAGVVPSRDECDSASAPRDTLSLGAGLAASDHAKREPHWLRLSFTDSEEVCV